MGSETEEVFPEASEELCDAEAMLSPPRAATSEQGLGGSSLQGQRRAERPACGSVTLQLASPRNSQPC